MYHAGSLLFTVDVPRHEFLKPVISFFSSYLIILILWINLHFGLCAITKLLGRLTTPDPGMNVKIRVSAE